MESVLWLQGWYLDQCNDDWEHRFGVRIVSLDNPGWLVEIDLAGTELDGRSIGQAGDGKAVNHAGIAGDHDWIDCRVVENQFRGAGGPLCLELICQQFRNWAEEAKKPAS